MARESPTVGTASAPATATDATATTATTTTAIAANDPPVVPLKTIEKRTRTRKPPAMLTYGSSNRTWKTVDMAAKESLKAPRKGNKKSSNKKAAAKKTSTVASPAKKKKGTADDDTVTSPSPTLKTGKISSDPEFEDRDWEPEDIVDLCNRITQRKEDAEADSDTEDEDDDEEEQQLVSPEKEQQPALNMTVDKALYKSLCKFKKEMTPHISRLEAENKKLSANVQKLVEYHNQRIAEKRSFEQEISQQKQTITENIQQIAELQEALRKGGAPTKAELNEQIVENTEKAVRQGVFRNIKFIEDEEYLVKVAKKVTQYMEKLPPGLSQDEYASQYKRVVNDAIGTERQYCQSEGKKRALGMSIFLLFVHYFCFAIGHYFLYLTQSSATSSRLIAHRYVLPSCGLSPCPKYSVSNPIFRLYFIQSSGSNTRKSRHLRSVLSFMT